MKFAVVSAAFVLTACSTSPSAVAGGDTDAPDILLTLDVGVADAPRDSVDAKTQDDLPAAPDTAVQDAVGLDVAEPPGLTADFRQWLAAHGYDAAALARDDLETGSFGGRASPTQAVIRDPVIFIHGNSDKAMGTTVGQTGWTASRSYFLQHGYFGAELYGTTWGPADANQAAQQTHSRKNVMHLRHFVEAVLAYTGATQVDIVAHSMGVTLARKVILGGPANDPTDGGAYDVGPPLSAHIDAFVGIAGANRGLTSCFMTGPTTPTCSEQNGLYPGTLVGIQVQGQSAFLQDLAAQSGYEGTYRYTIWSSVDEVIGYANLVYGQPTSRIPAQTSEVTFQTVPYGHFGLKDLTVEQQFSLVKNHQTP